jgi:signal peptide peptidase SppA
MRFGRLRALLPIQRLREPPPVVAVLRLAGVIGLPTAVRGNLTLANLAASIERAFATRGVKAVALAVSSPGGSPVQSALIHKRIRALAEEKEVPVFAFAEDVAASGGYWLALAADEIYADENSIVGSIGVISAGFGFEGLLERLGVERRVHAQGDKKQLLDPFAPEKPADLKRLEKLQKEIHESFKTLVRSRREGKLKGSDRKLFSGEFWTGREALELGLVDGLGDLRAVMRERFGDKVKLRLMAPERSWLRRRLGLSEAAAGPGAWAEQLIAAAEARALWARYGL